jgi:hypothetical protein
MHMAAEASVRLVTFGLLSIDPLPATAMRSRRRGKFAAICEVANRP